MGSSSISGVFSASTMSARTEHLISLGFRCNPDGSLARVTEPPITPAASSLEEHTQVLSKDVHLNPSTNTFIRLFLPRTALDTIGSTKLPIIIFAHGGGFIILRAVSTICHDFCCSIALKTPAFIVSVDYRLAPEHRLPAAYDDFMEALHWIKTTNDEWLTKYADLSNCYLMGSSSGGNIAFHAGLRAAACIDKLKPLIINGLFLHQPFFGGVERTTSEIKLALNKILPLDNSDTAWELGLPIGADRDHEYCNPMNKKVMQSLNRIKDVGWKVMVIGCEGDTLVDRQKELVKALEETGVSVESQFVEGEYHGYDVMEPSKSGPLFAAIKEIVQFSI